MLITVRVFVVVAPFDMRDSSDALSGGAAPASQVAIAGTVQRPKFIPAGEPPVQLAEERRLSGGRQCRTVATRLQRQKPSYLFRENLQQQQRRATISAEAVQGTLWSIERITELIDGPIIRGVCDEHRLSMGADGRTWVRKRVLTTAYNPLTAEAACWLIAKELGLCVPEAAVFICDADENETSWLSREISPIVHWPPCLQFDEVVNLEQLGGLLALDVFTLNLDRHQGNLLLSPVAGNQLQLWGIDSGNALIGQAHDFLIRASEVPVLAGPPLNAVVPVARSNRWGDVAAEALRIAARISALSNELLTSFLREATDLGREPKIDQLADVLLRRRDDIVQLTGRYLAQIAKASQ